MSLSLSYHPQLGVNFGDDIKDHAITDSDTIDLAEVAMT